MKTILWMGGHHNTKNSIKELQLYEGWEPLLREPVCQTRAVSAGSLHSLASPFCKPSPCFFPRSSAFLYFVSFFFTQTLLGVVFLRTFTSNTRKIPAFQWRIFQRAYNWNEIQVGSIMFMKKAHDKISKDLEKSLRKSCLLAPPFGNIVLEVATNRIKRKAILKEFNSRRKRWKILLYL